MKEPEKAIEAIVRDVGVRGARLALELLPGKPHFTVDRVIRAVERSLDLGFGLGR
jgi:hypothetical protein